MKQPLALIHAGLGRAANWRPFLNEIDRPVSPLLIELPGHGLAEKYDTSRDFADQAVELAIEEMPSDPVPLIGHSFGAVLALRIAVERPYRVSSLVLVEPPFFAAVKGRWAYEKIERDLAGFTKKMASAEHANAAKEFHAIWGDGTPWNELSGEARAYMVDRIPLIPPGNTLLFDDRPGLLREGRLEELEMPVTFVDGGDSHPVISEIISTIGDRIPDAEWVTVPGAGHMLPITHPARLVEAIGDRLFVEPAQLN
ncbi:MAG: alpha/beta hydrolase [Silicimonas sp.]|nr:alpha/beta hydrolase [Silicimonas sp.]